MKKFAVLLLVVGVAAVYAARGEPDEAFAWLEKAFEQRDVWLSFLAVHRYWDPLRGDPRFTSLVKRIGLPLVARESGAATSGTP